MPGLIPSDGDDMKKDENEIFFYLFYFFVLFVLFFFI